MRFGFPLLRWALPALLALVHGVACAADVIVFSTPTFKSSLQELASAFERATGHRLVVTYDSVAALKRRIEASESFDVALLLPDAIDALAKAGRIDPSSVTPLARSAVGVAVHTGLPVPDVGSIEALKSALSQARSLAYGPDSASGGYFVKVLDRVGLPDARAKLKPVAGGHVMDAVAKGDADMTVITVPNIVGVPGVTLAGKLPEALQHYTTFTGGVAAAAASASAGRALLRFLTTEQAAASFERFGFDRPAP